jgi:hypothetical protein
MAAAASLRGRHVQSDGGAKRLINYTRKSEGYLVRNSVFKTWGWQKTLIDILACMIRNKKCAVVFVGVIGIRLRGGGGPCPIPIGRKPYLIFALPDCRIIGCLKLPPPMAVTNKSEPAGFTI